MRAARAKLVRILRLHMSYVVIYSVPNSGLEEGREA